MRDLRVRAIAQGLLMCTGSCLSQGLDSIVTAFTGELCDRSLNG